MYKLVFVYCSTATDVIWRVGWVNRTVSVVVRSESTFNRERAGAEREGGNKLELDTIVLGSFKRH